MNEKELMLIVDDMDINRDVLAEMFEDKFTILMAEDGKECIGLVEEYGREIRLILLDLQMPVMSGFEVLKYRQQNPAFQRIPVIIITVNDELTHQMNAFQLGATDYITKPFIRDIVIYRVNNVLSSHKRMEEILTEKAALQIKSQLDLMTGLYNKATVEEVISCRLTGNKCICALLIIDIDDFKHVNDQLGHLVGDHTIRIIADLISGHFRKADIIGRIGGDEFIVFMEDLPSRRIACEKANSLVKTLCVKPNVTVPANVSISIGLAITEPRAYTYSELFHHADSALYTAKLEGKGKYKEYGVPEQKRQKRQLRRILLFSQSVETCAALNALAEDYSLSIDLVPPDYIADNSQYAYNGTLFFVLDIATEEDGGSGLIGLLKQAPWLSSIPFFTFCGEGCMKQYKNALEAGTVDILPAPIDLTYLRRRIEVFLEKGMDDRNR